jgi:hypothetical protein
MLNIARALKPWKEAASLNAQINLYGFWDETTFLTKSGDVGMVLRVGGVDYESLDSGEQEYAVKRLEGALRAFGPCFHVYQYLFKRNCPDIPFVNHEDPVVATAVDQRRRFFEAKRDQLYSVKNRFTIERDQTNSLYFLNGDVQRAVIDQERKDNVIQTYIKDSSLPYVDVEVIKNVILDDLRQSPYSARIEFEKVFTNPAVHSEIKRERWTASVTYVFREKREEQPTRCESAGIDDRALPRRSSVQLGNGCMGPLLQPLALVRDV